MRLLSKAGESACCRSCGQAARRVFSTFASFSKSTEGASSPIGGSRSSCTSCGATSCATCH
ncbi:hypothetical protein ACFLVX_04100 [Chloroflexota bacterium]